MAESGLMVNASIDDDFMADGRIAGWFWIQLFQLEVSCVTVSRLIPNSHALRLYPAIGYIKRLHFFNFCNRLIHKDL
jgi:hypothetical protein